MEEPKVELVTPKKAEAWLNKNKGNRNLRSGGVERYAADMTAGKWTQCPVPISFYEDGDIADGQHRLFAIVESGTSQRFIIVRGLAKEDGLNIDTGMTRTVVDNARIAGTGDNVTNVLLTISRGIAEGAGSASKSRSNSQKLAMLEEYREPSEFVNSHLRRIRAITISPILAAVGRAYMHENDKERLKRYCHVLATGFMENDDESSAIAMRNYLLMKGGLAAMAINWGDTFLKAQNSIYTFMRGRAMQTIKKIGDERYPLVKTTHKPLRGLKGKIKEGPAKQAAA